MPGKLKEVKERIASVKSTQQITKAMKLVAASKLKKATDAIVQMRPYSRKLSDMLSNIATATEGDVNIAYAQQRHASRALLVVITSDKGLCGGFNTNVIKAARLTIENELAPQRAAGKLAIMPIGKKGYDFFKKYNDCRIIADNVDLLKHASFEQVSEVAQEIMNGFLAGAFDKVVVAYGEFRNAAVQYFKVVPFLPIPRNDAAQKSAAKAATVSSKKVDYIFEPEKVRLIEELTPKILKTQFFSFILDNNASEHGARMTAMDNASKNANELLNELRIRYNKERQAAITTELTEIVSGAAALQG